MMVFFAVLLIFLPQNNIKI